jgi:hypothetical protein
MKRAAKFGRTRRIIPAGIAGILLAVSIAACGSSTSSSSTAAAAAGSGVSTGSARYQARLNLAKCFRAHGINVPDPSPGGGAGGGGGVFRSLQGYPAAKVTAARQACGQYLRKAFAFGNLSPAQVAQFRQQFVKWATCMRSHGINIPDPAAGSSGFGLRGALSNIDRNSPAFKSAQQACQSLRPRLRRGGSGGGPLA